MFFSNLFSKSNSILGIDIGTSNIKIAEVLHGAQPILKTYGIVNSPFVLAGKDDEHSINKMAGVLKTLIEKAGATNKRCVVSFPNSSVFTSVVELPKMSDKELSTAVEFEAKKYVPLALSEIDLEWNVISQPTDQASTLKVLLTAVPKQVTKNYMRVFELAGLDTKTIVGEIEALALIRSLIGSESLNCVIIDIGAKSTGLNIIENGLLRLSRNLNIGGDTITNKIAQSLNISLPRAEQFKKDFGVSNTTFIPDTIKPVLSIIKNEAKQLMTIYQSQNIKLDKIILVGGGANLPGLVDFFSDLKLQVELGNPLKSVGFSQGLESVLKRYSLSLPIAIGLALRTES
jgi:type IV pilus assembly protein PilM